MLSCPMFGFETERLFSISTLCCQYLILAFSEAMNSKRELFGDDRLTDAIANCEATSAKDMLDEVRGEVETFVELAERHDDMTMIVVKFDTKPAEA